MGFCWHRGGDGETEKDVQNGLMPLISRSFECEVPHAASSSSSSSSGLTMRACLHARACCVRFEIFLRSTVKEIKYGIKIISSVLHTVCDRKTT